MAGPGVLRRPVGGERRTGREEGARRTADHWQIQSAGPGAAAPRRGWGLPIAGQGGDLAAVRRAIGEARRGEWAARLTGREAAILAALLASPGRLAAEPGRADAHSRQAVQRHIAGLRRKLRAAEVEAGRDRGYRLVG